MEGKKEYQENTVSEADVGGINNVTPPSIQS